MLLSNAGVQKGSGIMLTARQPKRVVNDLQVWCGYNLRVSAIINTEVLDNLPGLS